MVRRAFLCWVVLALAGCSMPASPQGRGAGPGGRQQALALTPEQELEAGRRAYRKVLSEYHDRLLPATDPQVVRVRRVCGRIVKAAGIEPLQQEIKLRLHDYRFEWEENVVREKQINAFCLPGGKIIVFTGLLEFVGKDDDQLAAVLAHEISHALAHHGSERIAVEHEKGAGVLAKLKFNRDQEAEADHIGVFLMTFAGYDPEGAVRFWQHMSRAGQSRLPELLSDHPNDAHRAAALKGWMPWARKAKQAYDKGNVVRSSGR